MERTPLIERVPNLALIEDTLIARGVYKPLRWANELRTKGEWSLDCFTGYQSEARRVLDEMADAGTISKNEVYILDRLISLLIN